jgi:hypothetical protein
MLEPLPDEGYLVLHDVTLPGRYQELTGQFDEAR